MATSESCAASAEEDPDSISKTFVEKIADGKTKSLRDKRIQFIVLTCVIFVILNLGYSGLAMVGTASATINYEISGEVMDNTAYIVPQTKAKDKVKLVKTRCDLGYKLVPKLAAVINATKSSCGEKRELAKIAYHESTGGIHLKNPVSSASGPYQYLDSTWDSSGCSKFGPKNNFTAQTKCVLRVIRGGGAYQHWYKWW